MPRRLDVGRFESRCDVYEPLRSKVQLCGWWFQTL